MEHPRTSRVVEDDDDVDVAVEDDDDEDEISQFRDPPLGKVRLRPSQFLGIPPTVFFEYPPELRITRTDESVIEDLQSRKLVYKSYWERICIKNAFLRAGFERTERAGNKTWTALWSKHQNESQMRELNCLQKINHFPSSWCIGRKDRLCRTMNGMRRLHGSYYDFHPEGYILPSEKDAFARQVNIDLQSTKGKRGDAEKSLWIMKPVASSCGKGIKVVNGQQALNYATKNKKAIMQRYLDSPYLIDGKKFDLRIYVLVSGVDPLRVYIHNEGLTRISTAEYSVKNIGNKFAHLTNYSINKKSENFKAASADDAGGEREGFKWSLAAFRRWLAEKESPEVMRRTMDKICDLCVKTMIAAESEITPKLHSAANYRSNCFELFGCDVILDAQLNPHLLEVNVSPSLMGSSPLDKKIKGTVMADVFHIVGMYPYDPALLRKFNNAEAQAGSVGVSGGGGSSGSDAGNPFAFNSLGKMIGSQENWRRAPCPANIDISTLGNNDCSWLLLLMAEDEFARARSTQFTIAHPTPLGAAHYNDLYRSARFSDHLLAKWVIEGGSTGSMRKYIPSRFLKNGRPSTANAASGKSGSERSGTMAMRSGGDAASVAESGDGGRRLISASGSRSRLQAVENATSLLEYERESRRAERSLDSSLEGKDKSRSNSVPAGKASHAQTPSATTLGSMDASSSRPSSARRQMVPRPKSSSRLRFTKNFSQPIDESTLASAYGSLRLMQASTAMDSSGKSRSSDRENGGQDETGSVASNAASLGSSLNSDPNSPHSNLQKALASAAATERGRQAGKAVEVSMLPIVGAVQSWEGEFFPMADTQTLTSTAGLEYENTTAHYGAGAGSGSDHNNNNSYSRPSSAVIRLQRGNDVGERVRHSEFINIPVPRPLEGYRASDALDDTSQSTPMNGQTYAHMQEGSSGGNQKVRSSRRHIAAISDGALGNYGLSPEKSPNNLQLQSPTPTGFPTSALSTMSPAQSPQRAPLPVGVNKMTGNGVGFPQSQSAQIVQAAVAAVAAATATAVPSTSTTTKPKPIRLSFSDYSQDGEIEKRVVMSSQQLKEQQQQNELLYRINEQIVQNHMKRVEKRPTSASLSLPPPQSLSQSDPTAPGMPPMRRSSSRGGIRTEEERRQAVLAALGTGEAPINQHQPPPSDSNTNTYSGQSPRVKQFSFAGIPNIIKSASADGGADAPAYSDSAQGKVLQPYARATSSSRSRPGSAMRRQGSQGAGSGSGIPSVPILINPDLNQSQQARLKALLPNALANTTSSASSSSLPAPGQPSVVGNIVSSGSGKGGSGSSGGYNGIAGMGMPMPPVGVAVGLGIATQQQLPRQSSTGNNLNNLTAAPIPAAAVPVGAAAGIPPPLLGAHSALVIPSALPSFSPNA